jgi:UvrD/REP helicase N-terminal domain
MTPEHLLATERGLVVAPAGCGKTYLLAETVKANTIGRILVLTHTRAGVAVIRSRLVNVPSSSYRVDTLDHWAAWIATRFPATSRYEPTNTPRDYDLAKQAAVRLLEGSTIRGLVTCTYSRVLVDEYQDCGRLQHDMVKRLAAAVPTAALGDPMQRVFGFRGGLVDWADVEEFFGTIWTLGTPHRWNRVGEPDFGLWVLRQRERLLANRPVDVRTCPSHVRWIELSGDPSAHIQQQLAAIPAPASASTLLVINAGMEVDSRRDLARRGVRLAVVERADLPDLPDWAARIEAATSLARVRLVLEFAHQVVTGIEVDAAMDRLAAVQRGAARTPATADDRLLLSLAAKPDTLAIVLGEISRGKTVFRPELYEAMRQAARMPIGSLSEAASRVQARRSAEGRRVEPRAIGSTLLLKGLECDHAIVLDADGMTANDLYVSLSRASRSVTVVSRSPILPPNFSRRDS